ncbi:MAG: hypothetical protein PHT29_04495 [Eubacteriales bacterium]|jgi:hypothetical protein|nr:hypothetical protein [Eubacteriales bacterium]MDD3290123.1 hypothetical protein [Eubacteriales bacterium]MDD3863364.1 hypothetical protein [Eubacteriales bacterium]
MKQFLVLMAVLPLLLIFLLQFSLDQINHSRIGLLSDCVYVAREQARQKGCFTQDICDELKQSISQILDTDPESVQIEATETPQYRILGGSLLHEGGLERGLIYYKISVPMGQIMAGPRLFGIREEDNQLMFAIESWTASERLP